MVKHVAIIHPDLGIGGAEQLIVNIAVALQLTDHQVTVYTPRHEKERSFKQTHDGTLKVKVVGNVIPATIMGKGKALCSLIRMFFACMYVVLFGGEFDYIIVDQVSAVLPVFWLSRSKVVFYCHYPDFLLCTERTSWVKRAYRFVLDGIEEFGLRQSNLIYVNSKFTQNITATNFKSVPKDRLAVLYPSIDLTFSLSASFPGFLSNSPYFFSLNRYEKKKNINLAIEAYSFISKRQAKLLIGGGYDPQLHENIEHFKELCQLCDRLGLKWCEVSVWNNPQPGFDVYFAKNLTEQQREEALQNAISVLYTPENGRN
jgi:alpha-1,3/alpha-1,6-mannosyltransferase